MTYAQISELLDRYWDGETTLEEERQIKAYFTAGSVDARLQKVAPLFAVLRQEQGITATSMPSAPAMRVSHVAARRRWLAAAALVGAAALGGWWAMRSPAPDSTVATTLPVPAVVQPVLPVAPPEVATAPTTQPRLAAKKTRKKTSGSAVVINQTPPPVSPDTDTYDDPEKALAEIRAALSLVSGKLNKGKKETIRHLEQVEQATQLGSKTNG
jgi:hypothetical protein